MPHNSQTSGVHCLTDLNLTSVLILITRRITSCFLKSKVTQYTASCKTLRQLTQLKQRALLVSKLTPTWSLVLKHTLVLLV